MRASLLLAVIFPCTTTTGFAASDLVSIQCPNGLSIYREDEYGPPDSTGLSWPIEGKSVAANVPFWIYVDKDKRAEVWRKEGANKELGGTVETCEIEPKEIVCVVGGDNVDLTSKKPSSIKKVIHIDRMSGKARFTQLIYRFNSSTLVYQLVGDCQRTTVPKPVASSKAKF